MDGAAGRSADEASGNREALGGKNRFLPSQNQAGGSLTPGDVANDGERECFLLRNMSQFFGSQNMFGFITIIALGLIN